MTFANHVLIDVSFRAQVTGTSSDVVISRERPLHRLGW